jgi:serine protease inhibitor
MAAPAKQTLRRTARIVPILALLLGGVAANAAPAGTGSEPALSERIMSAQGALSLNLVAKLAEKKPGANIVVSPASLAGALAIIEIGGAKELQSNMHGLLGFKKSPNAELDFEGLRYATGEPRKDGPLASANAILFDHNVEPDAGAIEILSRSAVRATVADFSNPDTLAEINKWVSEKTSGKIPTVLDELPKETALVALNAVYFKDQWRKKFDPKETAPTPFHLVGGKTVDVPLMHSDGNFLFRQDARFIAVDLRYASRGYSLTVVTTKSDPAPAKDFAKLSDWLAGASFTDGPGEITLPRFGATANVDLLPTLAALGLVLPSTLPGFARGPLRLGKVQQRVELKVDEEGTEAAAATALTAERGVPSNYVKLVADKPFMFALRDATSGLVVVAGYVADPVAPANEAEAK